MVKKIIPGACLILLLTPIAGHSQPLPPRAGDGRTKQVEAPANARCIKDSFGNLTCTDGSRVIRDTFGNMTVIPGRR
jgi:hypothetical protein